MTNREKDLAIAELTASLQGMLESYDILTTQTPLARNDLALGVIKGSFMRDPAKARVLVQKYGKGT